MGTAEACALGAPLVLGVAALTGRLHIALAGPRRLHQFGPFQACPSAALGVAWWTLVLTAASSWGFQTSAALVAGLGLAAVGLFAVIVRGRSRILRPSGSGRAWLALALPLGLTGLVALGPVLGHGRFAAENDSLLYSALAQWYEDHPFRETQAFDEGQPIAHYAAVYHEAGYPMAPALLLAAAARAVRASSPLLVYPAWSASGLVLALGLLITVGRRVLRWPVRFVGGAGLGLAALLQPLTWAHHLGFLAQTFAVGLLLAALLHLSGLRSGSRLGFSDALLAALLAASLAVTYPPFLVLLAGGFATWLLTSSLAGERLARRARFALACGGLFAVFVAAQGLDLIRAFRFLGGTRVGGHVDLSLWGFVEATLGAWVWAPFALGPLAERLRGAQILLAPLYALLAWRGLRRVARECPGTFGPFLGAMAVLAAGLVWFSVLARDPWTGARGHSWNLFKLTQWAFPFSALVVLHGLSGLGRGPWRYLPRAAALVPLLLVPVHLAFADRLGRDFEAFVGSPRPLDSWEAMRRRLREVSGSLVAADRPEASTPFLPTYLGLLVYPKALAGEWAGALWIPSDPLDRAMHLLDALAAGEGAEAPRVIPVVVGLRGFVTAAVDRVSGAIGLVRDPRSPQVLALLQSSSDPTGPGGCVFIARRRTTLRTFSPRPLTAVLTLTSTPGIGPLPPDGVGLLVTSAGQPPELRRVRFPRIEVPVTLARGGGRVELEFPDPSLADDWRVCVLAMGIVAQADAR
jgi:hypothetical protein